jgi:hypothetical protein
MHTVLNTNYTCLIAWKDGALEQLSGPKSKTRPAVPDPVWEEELVMSSESCPLHSAEYLLLEVFCKGLYGKTSVGQAFIAAADVTFNEVEHTIPLSFFKDQSISSQGLGVLSVRVRRVQEDLRNDTFPTSTISLTAVATATNEYSAIWPADAMPSNTPLLQGETTTSPTPIESLSCAPTPAGLTFFDNTFLTKANGTSRRASLAPHHIATMGTQELEDGIVVLESYENERRGLLPPFHFNSRHLLRTDPKKYTDEVC